MDYLGADQQQPSPLFIRTFYKTDFQKVLERMISILKERAKFDIINPQLWSQIGIFGGPVEQFLENYMAVAISMNESLEYENAEDFISEIHNKYGTPISKVKEYVDVFLVLSEGGEVPESILEPWKYEPTSSIGEDIERGVKKGTIALALVGIAVVGVYAFASRGAPRIITGSRR